MKKKQINKRITVVETINYIYVKQDNITMATYSKLTKMKTGATSFFIYLKGY